MFKENKLYQTLIKLAHDLQDLNGDNCEIAEQIMELARNTASLTIRGSLPEVSVMRSIDLLLKDCGIKYAVIGGLAVGVWGQSRSTDDIDILVDKLPPIEKTRDRDYMRTLGFYPKKSFTGTILTLDHDKGMVELLVADNNVRKWALDNAANASILGVSVPVISAAGLVATKVRACANNVKRQPRDVPDIQSVMLSQNINVDEIKKLLTDDEKKFFDSIIIKQLGDVIEVEEDK